MSGENPLLYCTITLIAMQGHQTKQRGCSEGLGAFSFFFKDGRHDKLGLQLNLLHCVEDRKDVDEENLQSNRCRRDTGKLSNNKCCTRYFQHAHFISIVDVEKRGAS